MSVFIGSTPNTEKDDILLVKGILKKRISVEGSKKHLSDYFRKEFDNTPFLFNKGRDSLYFLLKSLNLKEDDEVIIQPFTCVAVVAPILWTRLKPIYTDINLDSYNMDLEHLKEKITEKSRVVILQHTFGNIADTQRVRRIVDDINKGRDKSKKIYIVEDCAHIYTENHKNLGIGLYSDAFFFSFSQDKSISSTQGAALFINNPNLLENIKREYTLIEELSSKEESYILHYILLWNIIKKTYFKTVIPFTNISIGRILLILFRALGLIKKQASVDTLISSTPIKMSNTQAKLLLNQINKVNRLNKGRKRCTQRYNSLLKERFRFNSKNHILLRYPILIDNRKDVKERLKKKRVIGGIWYASPVFPFTNKTTLEQCMYEIGSCPNTESIADKIFNLPTNIEVSDQVQHKIIDIVNTFAKPSAF